jgi:hypothetical protein
MSQWPDTNALTVVSLFAGDRYAPEYVSRLRNAVRRNLSVPYRFVCMTDRPGDIDCETMPVPMNLPGWWGKIALFSQEVFPGRRLFLDLDSVITGSLDDFAKYTGELAVIRPFPGDRDKGINSGLMNIGPGAHAYVWERFRMNPEAAIRFCYANAVPAWNYGDQRWLELMISRVDYWQELNPGQVCSYKFHCRDGLPENARVVSFHGRPDPHEVAEAWVRENWI